MTRTLLSGIAAAALLSLLATAPAGAGGTGWGCRTCGYSNGTQLSGLVTTDGVATAPGPQRDAIDGAIGTGKPTVVAQFKAKRGGQGSGTGWGCRTCGYSNGPQLTGFRDPASIAPAAGSVTLPSGEILVLR